MKSRATGQDIRPARPAKSRFGLKTKHGHENNNSASPRRLLEVFSAPFDLRLSRPIGASSVSDAKRGSTSTRADPGLGPAS